LSAIATIRPDSWDLPLFLHVLGAMVLVGGLALAATYLFSAWRGGSPDSLRFALRALTLAALPGYIVMRGTAEWIADKEGLNDLAEDPDWIGIGYTVADGGFVLLVVASLAAWLTLRRGVGAGVRVAAVLVGLLLIADVVAIWAMTTKPV
jgi:uncharacterized membrane protein